MISISYKTKQILLVLIKLFIVCGAVFFLLSELKQKEEGVNWNVIKERFSFITFIGLLFMSLLNWILECLKWKNLVSSFTKITFSKAVEQSLGSLTASIFTPNRVGEYAAKCLYYSKEKTKRIIFLNFLGNSTQMLVTVFFGIIGVLFLFILSPLFGDYESFENSYLFWLPILLILGILIFIFKIKKWIFYGYSIEHLWGRIRLFPARKHFANFQYSVLRYLLFSHQFYVLLLIFHVEISYSDAILTVFTMYFLASIIPTIHLMDVVIKGSIAVFLFGKLGVDEWIIVSITTLMWLMNLVLPVLIGTFYVVKYKPLNIS